MGINREMPANMSVNTQNARNSDNGGDKAELATGGSFHSLGSAGNPHRFSGNPPFGTEIIEVDPHNLSASLQVAFDVIMDFEASGEMPPGWEVASTMTEPVPSTVNCKMDNGELKAATTVEGIPCGVDVVTHLLLMERMNWDLNFTQYYIAERATSTIGPPIDVLYCRCKSPMPMIVSDRDYVQLRLVTALEDGGVAVICLPTVRASLPEVPDAVRTDTLCSGYIIRPSKTKPGHSDMFFCTHTRVGNVPSLAVNWGAGQGYGQWVQRIVSACTVGSTSASRATYEHVMNGKGVPLAKSKLGHHHAASEGSEGSMGSFYTVHSDHADGIGADHSCWKYGTCNTGQDGLCAIQ